MGYIKDFRENLAEKLSLLDEESRKEIINYAADTCLESYKNGLKAKALVKKALKTKEGEGNTAPVTEEEHGA